MSREDLTQAKGAPPMQPIEIYQDVLDLLSDAALNGDTDVFRRYICLPFTVTTQSGTFVTRTCEDLFTSFRVFTDMLKSQGTTDYIRLARDARFVGPGLIEGVHYTHALRDGFRVMAPYASRMVIRREGDLWRVTDATHAVADRWPLDQPHVTGSSEVPPEPIFA
jgi:hypothetical protein